MKTARRTDPPLGCAHARSGRGRARPSVLAALALAALLFAWGDTASARMSVIYDFPHTAEALLGAGLGVGTPDDGIYQQWSGVAVLPMERQVEKVSSGLGSPGTPSIRDLTAAEMEALLARQIELSGAHMVFLDELGKLGERGRENTARLKEALLSLSQRPFDGTSYARRVHLYVEVPPLLEDAAGDAFDVMRLAGGVWLQAYRPPIPTTAWSPEEWLALPRALAARLLAPSDDPRVPAGDLPRVHLMLGAAAQGGMDQAAQWRLARTGAACRLLANGPGAYRLSAGNVGGDPADPSMNPEVTGFVREFRALFGTEPAPRPHDAAPSPVPCIAPRVLDDHSSPTATALSWVMALPRTGLPLPGAPVVDGARAVEEHRLPLGVASEIRLDLGGPRGIAAVLGVEDRAFWSEARAAVAITGAGIAAWARVGSTGEAVLSVTPLRAGPLELALSLDGAAVTRALGPPAVDLALTLDCERHALPGEGCTEAARLADAADRGVLDRALADPLAWRLSGIRLMGPVPERPLLAAG